MDASWCGKNACSLPLTSNQSNPLLLRCYFDLSLLAFRLCKSLSRVERAYRELIGYMRSRAGLSCHVRCHVNRIRQLRDGNLEPTLHIVQHLRILVGRDERNRQALRAETACAADAMKVRVCFGRHVVVDYNVDSLHINTSTKDVCRHKNALLEIFEGFVPSNPVLLVEPAMYANGRKVAIYEQLVQLRRTCDAPNKDDDLIELERVQQIIQLSVLLALLQIQVVLKQSV
mmetsp:Transcript_11140/g.34135  ORF Transcript_11140/g.34135 Transcript_11140/m.34135 type:complete len:230 (+) Transcript_11140:436-1125(+)